MGIVFEICLIVFITLFPPFQSVFHTSPLGVADYAFLCCLPPLVLAVEEARKALFRRIKRRRARASAEGR